MMDVREKIQKVMDEKINVQLELHNGSSQISYFEDGVLGIKFLGACASCMASSDTFENVVKKTIMEEIPEVKDVQFDQTVSDDILDFAKKILSGQIK